MTSDFPTDWVRARFPGLAREVAGRPALFLDGPGGSQVPQAVVDAVSHYLLHTNANLGGAFATSLESDRVVQAGQQACADLLGAADHEEIVFGANMTTLTMALAGALSRTWKAGDEVVVSRLEHDANFTPWIMAARASGAVVRELPVRPDCTLDLDALAEVLGPRTRLVAVGAASNLVGTVSPVKAISAAAREVGAEVFVDAVHYAAHDLVDVVDWGCDYLACSAYKFFGPHVGVLWGRRERLAALPASKLRPASDAVPARWMTGTQNHEGIAGTTAAIEYLTSLGRQIGGADLRRRAAIRAAFEAVGAHETRLCRRLLDQLRELPGVRVWGVVDAARDAERAPTVAITHERHSPQQLAADLAARGVFVWPGNCYALPLTEALGLEPDGVLRAGLLHYNTAAEVDRFVAELTACL